MYDTKKPDNAIVAIYKSHPEAEAAVMELQRAGFNMRNLSIVGRDYHTEEHVVGYYNAGDRMKYWGKQGAFWGGLWGLFSHLDSRGAGRRGRSWRSKRHWRCSL
jgi:hypothetical protein